MVSISNGKAYNPAIGCTLEALSSLGDVCIVSACEPGVSGADWTRTIVHWQGHYFVVLDDIQALDDSEFNLVCRWRSPNLATLSSNVWVARAGDATLRLANAEPLAQVAEQWECDGSCRPFVLTQYKHAALRRGERIGFQNLFFVAGTNRPDAFAVRRLTPDALLVKGRTATGAHLALIGLRGQAFPLKEFETDAAVYHVTTSTLTLAQATVLRSKHGGAVHEILRSATPCNLVLDCLTGRGQVAATPLDKPDFLAAPQPLRVDPSTLPQPAVSLAALWDHADAPPAASVARRSVGRFKTLRGDTRLERPLKRLLDVQISSTPPPNRALRELTDGLYTAQLSGNAPTWGQTDNLQITVDLGRPQRVARLRLVSTLKPLPLGPGHGAGQYVEGDFTFGLALSNDGFSNAVHTVTQPRVRFEETALYPIWHYALGRLPTFVIDVDAEARYLRLSPAARNPEVRGLFLNELEILAAEPVDELTAQAFAADVDGDGDNELVLGTSQQELAVFKSNGRLLWRRNLSADVFTMGCADLNEDGTREILVYTTREELRRFNGDGSERTPADIRAAFVRDAGWCGVGGMITMAAWAPDGVTNKEVMLWSEGCARVLYDGSVKTLKSGQPRGAGRLVNLWPGEPEVLVAAGFAVDFWSARRDADGNYIRLAGRTTAGEGGGPLMRGFGWVQAVDEPGHQGVLAANNGGLNYWPISALVTNATEGGGWGFDNGGVPNVAALLETNRPAGSSRVFLARLDGFVNVFDLDGKELALLNAEGPIIGMALLGQPGRPRWLAVGTRFGVTLFSPELKRIGFHAAPAVAFAGPGGRKADRVYLVDGAGHVTVLVPR